MFSKIILFFIFAYLFFKASRFLKKMFSQVNSHSDEPKVHQAKKNKPKIDQKDVIDAKFEEIDGKENSSSETK